MLAQRGTQILPLMAGKTADSSTWSGLTYRHPPVHGCEMRLAERVQNVGECPEDRGSNPPSRRSTPQSTPPSRSPHGRSARDMAHGFPQGRESLLRGIYFIRLKVIHTALLHGCRDGPQNGQSRRPLTNPTKKIRVAHLSTRRLNQILSMEFFRTERAKTPIRPTISTTPEPTRLAGKLHVVACANHQHQHPNR